MPPVLNRIFPPVLSRYLIRVYLTSFLSILAILLGLVFLFDTVELLRRAAKFESLPLSLILEMSLFKLPQVGQTILPFAILFSALHSFWLLVRRQELVILRAGGLPVWQFLAPIIGIAVCIGVFHTALINPLSALMISRYDRLEDTHLKTQKNEVSVGKQGLWLRQKAGDRRFILHASHVDMPSWGLTDITILFFDEGEGFLRRIDAQTGRLETGAWVFLNAVSNEAGRPTQHIAHAKIATSLTPEEIEESFSSAEETAFWSLPSYIETMEETGFDSTKLRIHFHTLLAGPLLFAAMIILAATVSLRATRTHPTALLIGGGVAIGFLVFFLGSFLKALGASDQIPVIVAAWFPPVIALLLGVSVIMTTEDG